MTDFSAASKLDPREEHFRIPGPRPGLSLFLRFLPAAPDGFQARRAVLYTSCTSKRCDRRSGPKVSASFAARTLRRLLREPEQDRAQRSG